jgi:hypothetical protein
MARGWESKSVEDQMDAAAAAKSAEAGPPRSASERERLARRSTLLLARVKTAKDLESSKNPRHRAMLERALADLDATLSQEDAAADT